MESVPLAPPQRVQFGEYIKGGKSGFSYLLPNLLANSMADCTKESCQSPLSLGYPFAL
jgi:hypothetical protein